MEIVDFNLDALTRVANGQMPQLDHKARKARARAPLPPPPEPATPPEMPADAVVLVDRHVGFECPLPLPIADYYLLDPSGRERRFALATADIRLSVDKANCLLMVYHRRLSPKFLLMSVHLPELADFYNVYWLECYVLGMTRARQERNNLSVVEPVLRLALDGSSNTVRGDISYAIRQLFRMFGAAQLEVVDKIRAIVGHQFNPQLVFPVAEIAEDPLPHLFYLSVLSHTRQMAPVDEAMEIPELETSLLRFQRTSVQWMLARENVRYDWDTHRCVPVPVVTPEQFAELAQLRQWPTAERRDDALDRLVVEAMLKLTYGWDRVCHGPVLCFYNPFLGEVVGRHRALDELERYARGPLPQYLPAQGLLAEEMGLGKTVEVTATVLLSQRPPQEINGAMQHQHLIYGVPKTVIKARTTLIIAPELILKQWVTEIENLAPSLALTIYRGIGKYPKLDDNPALIAEYLRKFDVVLTTYLTILRELDYAKFLSKTRTTRHLVQRDQDYRNYFEELTPEPGDDEALETYRNMFQLLVTLVKPRIANTRLEGQGETDYERALQDEINLAIVHNRVPEIYKLKDYELPLMLLHWWRVVLDEVQMVSSKFSRAFQLAALIPRFHAWGVLGTPIKRKLEDLHLILEFLRYLPFYGDGGRQGWQQLVADPQQFVRLWTTIAIRHTKAMVHDDIELPPQNRVLLTQPFLPIEQDNYNTLLQECLASLCLDVCGNPTVDGWEPTPLMMMYMRGWLQRLRQLCNNPQIGKLVLNLRKYKKSHLKAVSVIQKLNTLDYLLQDMLTASFQDINDEERAIVAMLIDVGAFFEFIYLPRLALEYLKVAAVEVEKIIERTAAMVAQAEARPADDDDDDAAGTARARLRLWKVTLHKLYFLVALAHFQLYDPEYQAIVAARQVKLEYPRLPVLDYPARRQTETISELVGVAHDQPPVSLGLDPAVLAADAPAIENAYYDRAEAVRLELLSGTIIGVEQAVKARILSRTPLFSDNPVDEGLEVFPKSKKRFNQMPLLQLAGAEPRLAVAQPALTRLARLVEQLNTQASAVNLWVNRLTEVVSTPLVGANNDPSGSEYQQLIVDQDQALLYLIVLGEVLNERMEWIQGTEALATKRAKRAAHDDSQVEDVAFLHTLRATAELVRPSVRYSLQDMLAEIKDLGPDYAHLGSQLMVMFDNQKATLVYLTKEVGVNLNLVFNTRIEYFKQLQQISDSVKTTEFNMFREQLQATQLLAHLNKRVPEYKTMEQRLTRFVGRFRYLNGLFTAKEALEPEEMCIICRCNITIGLLTQCGHKYCKDCLEQWLELSGLCPMCKARIDLSLVYNFTQNKPELKALIVEDVAHTNKELLYLIYKPLPAETIEEIQLMPLKQYYLTKVDLIVKQVLYLRSHDPKVQIVVFSQWQDMLYIIGTAFMAADITFLGSYGTLVPEVGLGRRHKKYELVEEFKNPDNNITCFLLNARAQSSGLTLVNATHVFLCEPLVNISLELQAISRIHRIGQFKPTTVWMFAIENTVEESIAIMAANKRLEYVNSNREGSAAIEEKSLTEAESMALMNGEGIDTMVSSGPSQGETVVNSDLWSAFFASRQAQSHGRKSSPPDTEKDAAATTDGAETNSNNDTQPPAQ